MPRAEFSSLLLILSVENEHGHMSEGCQLGFVLFPIKISDIINL
jgi:hypothetical protein